jgi:uncharacterized protein YkwD
MGASGGTGGATALDAAAAGQGGTGAQGDAACVSEPSADAGSCKNDGTIWDSAWQALECELLDLVNQQRISGATCGTNAIASKPPLVRSQTLTDNARDHSSTGIVGFENPDGTPIGEWSIVGYCGAYVAGIVAIGQATAAEVFSSIKADASTCENLMADGNQIGIGYDAAPEAARPHSWTVVIGSTP